MRNRRFPHYPDDADYTTNAPSYYEDLARKEKLIRLLAERIWGYEKILDDTLEEIQERFRVWDKKLEDFPDDVKILLQQWLDDGTLDHIINDTIFSWKLDTEIFEQFKLSTIQQLTQNGVDIRLLGAKENNPTFDNKTIIEQAIATYKRIKINGNFYTSPLTVDVEATFFGEGRLTAIGTQTHILHVKKPIQIMGKLFLDGNYTTDNGFLLEDAARSNIHDMSAYRFKKWGVVFKAEGNNNLVRFGKLDALNCGSKDQVNFKQISSSGSASSTQRYGLMELDTAINTEGIYFAKIGGVYYKVVFDDSRHMRVYHHNIGDDVSGTATLLRGGGVDITKSGNNNDAYFSTFDMRGCAVALHCNAQYGPQLDGVQIQNCEVGFSTSDYTFSTVITRPYFELTNMYVLAWQFIYITIIEPGGNYDFKDKTYQMIYDTKQVPNLTLISGGKTTQMTVTNHSKNSANTLEVTPNHSYTIDQQANTTKNISIINNDFSSDMGGAPIDIYVICGTPGGSITLTITTNDGGLIENNTTHTVTVTDRQKVTLVKRNDMWRVFT